MRILLNSVLIGNSWKFVLQQGNIIFKNFEGLAGWWQVRHNKAQGFNVEL